MRPILSALRALPLRQRFLIAPVIGIGLLMACATLMFAEVQHRNTVLNRIADHDLTMIDDGHALAARWSRDQMDLMALFSAQHQGMDTSSSQIAQQATKLMHDLDDVDRLLAVMVPEDGSTGRGTTLTVATAVLQSNLLEQRRNVEHASIAYRDELQALIVRPTVGEIRGPVVQQVERERFRTLMTAYNDLLASERWHVRRSLQNEVLNGMTTSTVVVMLGILSSLLLLALTYLLARWLSDDLNQQIDALTTLSNTVPKSKKSSVVAAAVDKGDEIRRITTAIRVFRHTVGQLQKKEQVLALTNDALVTTLEQLDRTRSELENRFEERTEALKVINNDLTMEIERRTEVEQSLVIYAEAIRSTGEAVVITDGDGLVLEVNPAYELAMGISADRAVGRRIFDEKALSDEDVCMRAGAHEDLDRQALIGGANMVTSHEDMWNGLRTEGHWSGETTANRENGSSFPCLLHANAVGQNDNGTNRFVFVLRDITALKQSEQQLTHLAFHDPLTALPNRALFNARLTSAVAQVRAGVMTLAVMFLDLDRFKAVNDTLGHGAGDELLQEVSRRLLVCTRSSDTVARRGGDEFTVLLTGACTPITTEIVAHRILAAMSKPFDLHGNTVNIGVSIGISLYDGHAPIGFGNRLKEDEDEAVSILQKHADIALYEAKRQGRGQHQFFTPALLEHSERRSVATASASA